MASSGNNPQNNPGNWQEHNFAVNNSESDTTEPTSTGEPSDNHDTQPFDDSYTIQDSRLSTELHKGLGKLYSTGLLTDVVLKVGKERFPCHRNVLASVSPYFFAMFTNGLAESHQREVEITGIDAGTMKKILSYVYTTEVEITEDNVERLLVAANMLQLTMLVEDCGNFMFERVNNSNCIGMWIFGDTHNSSMLRDGARQWINFNFDIVRKEEEFLHMDQERLMDIIFSDMLEVEREEIVFEAAMSWLKYDIPQRKQYTADVLKYVRLVLLPPDYLFDRVEKEELVMSSPECVQYLDRVKQFHILKDRRNKLNLNTIPRLGMFNTDAIVCVDLKPRENTEGGDNQHVVDCYNPLDKKWACLPPLPKSVMFPGVVTAVINTLYVAGGTLKNESVSNNVYRYDILKNEWVQEPSMLHPRTQFGLVASCTHLYAIGGDSNGTSLSSVEAYNLVKKEWQELCPLPRKMRCHSTVMFNGVIYVLGGEIENVLMQRTLSNRVYKYLPNLDRWFEDLPMQIPRALAMATVLDNAIYIMGGFAELTQNWLSFSDPEHVLSATEVFRPQENYWSFGPHLPKEICAAGIVTLKNKIFVLGGEGEGDFWNHILMYDPELAYWMVLPDVLPEYVSSFGCAVVKFHNLAMIEEVKWYRSEEMPWMSQNQRVVGL
ncbi:hypothetical protein Bbelb_198100 [Branchiostoma belcheri]|nr:hypothetical protein Bbelb_198100 [Branchiostoma belcheri]